MARTIAIANQKGGVGKTTTAINLAALLAAAGSHTILIDLDPQANATSGLGIEKDHAGTRELLAGGLKEEMICETTEDGLDVIPSSERLLEVSGGRTQASRALRDAVRQLRELYQFIIIDCPPSLGYLTRSALVAADSVLIPVQAEYFSMEGLAEIIATIGDARRENPRLEIEKIVLTMHDPLLDLSREVCQEINTAFPEAAAGTAIVRDVVLAEAPSHGVPAHLYEPKSRGVRSYINLAKEILDNGKIRTNA